MTGAAAAFGTAELNGVRLALEEINARGGVNNIPIQLVVENTASSNLQTVNAITKLLAIDKVKYIIGPTWLDSFAGALPVVKSHGAILITPSAAVSVLKKINSNSPSPSQPFLISRGNLNICLSMSRIRGRIEFPFF